MITVDRCVVCEGDLRVRATGLVAPFLAQRIWDRKAFPIKIMHCGGCGFEFFNPRLDEHEAKLLYDEYRGARYQKMRFQHEPWYTEALNKGLSNEALMDNRRQLLESILGKHVALSDIKSVLDFGGDQGQLIQDLPVAEKYVYDISGVEKRPGIAGISTFTECLTRRYDLIVCSNVLEHVSFPRDLVSQMRQLAHPGTLLYLDAPLESPFSFMSIAKRIAQILIVCLARMRDAQSVLRPSALYLMHEHINFFATRSLANLAEHLDFEVVGTGRYDMKGPVLGGTCVWCLARLK